jgi:uncharacterized protein YsxB (DUF464 family)
MIKVLVRYNNSKEFESLTIKGHANSGPLGHDLVCAAISGIVLGGINNLQNKFSLTSDEKTGSLELKSLGKVSEHDNIVIETIITQINSIARDNPKNVKISVE